MNHLTPLDYSAKHFFSISATIIKMIPIEKFKVIPWEETREETSSFGGVTRFQNSGLGSSTSQGLRIVGIWYTNTETGCERMSTINHHFTNYKLEEIIKILWEFHDRNKSN